MIVNILYLGGNIISHVTKFGKFCNNLSTEKERALFYKIYCALFYAVRLADLSDLYRTQR